MTLLKSKAELNMILVAIIVCKLYENSIERYEIEKKTVLMNSITVLNIIFVQVSTTKFDITTI